MSAETWAGLSHEQVRELAKIVRAADEAHEVEGGGTRHWVRDHFLPELEAAGWTILPAPDDLPLRKATFPRKDA